MWILNFELTHLRDCPKKKLAHLGIQKSPSLWTDQILMKTEVEQSCSLAFDNLQFYTPKVEQTVHLNKLLKVCKVMDICLWILSL